MTLSTKRSLLIALGALLRGKKIRYKYSTTKTLKKIVKCLFKIFNLQQAATVKLIKTKESEEFEWSLTRSLIVAWLDSSVILLDDIVCWLCHLTKHTVRDSCVHKAALH